MRHGYRGCMGAAELHGRQPVCTRSTSRRKGSNTTSGEATCGSTCACRMTEGWQSPGFHPCVFTQYWLRDINAKSWKRPAAKGRCRQQCDATESACSNQMRGKAKEVEPRQSGLQAWLLRAAGVPVSRNHCLPVSWDRQAIGSACFTPPSR